MLDGLIIVLLLVSACSVHQSCTPSSNAVCSETLHTDCVSNSGSSNHLCQAACAGSLRLSATFGAGLLVDELMKSQLPG